MKTQWIPLKVGFCNTSKVSQLPLHTGLTYIQIQRL